MKKEYKCDKCGFEMDKESYNEGEGLCFACLMNQAAKYQSTGQKENAHTKEQIKCPNCGSMAIGEIKPGVIGIAMLMATPLLIFIPFLWILIPIMGIIAFGLILYTPFAKEYTCECKSCKYKWKYKKNEKEDYTKDFKIGDAVMVFINDRIVTGMIVNIYDRIDDKYLVVFNNEDNYKDGLYFSDDEMSLVKSK